MPASYLRSSHLRPRHLRPRACDRATRRHRRADPRPCLGRQRCEALGMRRRRARGMMLRAAASPESS